MSRGGPEGTVILYSKEGVERQVPRYRVEEFLGYGFRRTKGEIPVVESVVIPEEQRIEAILEKANKDLRTVRREDVMSVAEFYSLDTKHMEAEKIPTRKVLSAINYKRDRIAKEKANA